MQNAKLRCLFLQYYNCNCIYRYVYIILSNSYVLGGKESGVSASYITRAKEVLNTGEKRAVRRRLSSRSATNTPLTESKSSSKKSPTPTSSNGKKSKSLISELSINSLESNKQVPIVAGANGSNSKSVKKCAKTVDTTSVDTRTSQRKKNSTGGSPAAAPKKKVTTLSKNIAATATMPKNEVAITMERDNWIASDSCEKWRWTCRMNT